MGGMGARVPSAYLDGKLICPSKDVGQVVIEVWHCPELLYLLQDLREGGDDGSQSRETGKRRSDDSDLRLIAAWLLKLAEKGG